MIDRAAGNAEVRARLRASIVELAYDDTAANLTESVITSCKTPAVFVLLRWVEPIESLQVPGIKRQMVTVEVTVGLVTESVAPTGIAAPMKGTKGSDALLPKIGQALHWWKPTWARETLKFMGEEEPIAMGARLLSQAKFGTSVQEGYV